MMYRSYADTGGNVNEEIKLLNSISHVSARLARNLSLLAASQSEEGGKEAGFDPYEKKLLGITAMQKLLGKSCFDELLTAYIEKPQGKPTLVPDSDKRPAMNTAKNDFMEENDNE